MAHTVKQIQHIAKEMVENDFARDSMYRSIDNMWEGVWSLPPELTNLGWIHKTVSSDPHDAVRAGTRVLSSKDPRISMQPLGPHDKENTSKIERALQWHIKNASKRRRSNVIRDIVQSALLYDEVIAQVVYLPQEIKERKAFKQDTKRLEAAQRYGPYAIIVRNPKEVHVRYSDYMPEAVLLKRVARFQEVEAFWGEHADVLKKHLSNSDDPDNPYVTIYDYHDLETRLVWGIVGGKEESLSEPDAEGGEILLDEKNKLGFLPWVARAGGTNLYNEGTMQRLPLLWSVYKTGSWETQNITETLMISEVIAYAAAPRGVSNTASGESPDIDYGKPGRVIELRPGEQYEPILPPELDQNLQVVSDRFEARMGKSTIPRVLQTGDFPGGTAFATLNLATQSGMKALNPYKELAQQVIADICTVMLYFIDYNDDTVTGFYTDRTGNTSQQSIKKGDFDVDNIYISVELSPDVPTDRVARINAATMANEKKFLSREQGAEQIGVSDPDGEIKKIRQEELEDTQHAIMLMQMQEAAKREEQLKTQQAAFQQQMQQQQVMMQMQQQQQQGGGGGGGITPGSDQGTARGAMRGNPPAVGPNPRGQGFSPREGGQSSQEANPSGTRENVRGTDQSGVELA